MEKLIRTLPGLFEDTASVHGLSEALVFAQWRRVAGRQVVERTVPMSLTGSVLTIAVPDITWKRNLEHLASGLIFEFNSAPGVPKVTRIIFEIKELADRDLSGKEAEKLNAAKADSIRAENLSPALLKSSAAIRDDNMRRTFLRAAANCLARPGSK